MSRGYWGECTSLARARVLGMPHLHEVEVPGAAGKDLKRERQFNLAINYVTSSGEAKVVGTGL